MCQKRLAPGADPQLWMPPSHPETPDAPAFDMSITVGHNTAVEAGLSRTDVDQWAVYSHGRAIESIDSGAFASQLVPVEIAGSRRRGPALRHRRASSARPDAGGHGRAQGPPSRDRRLHRDGRQRCGRQRRRGGGAAHGRRLRGSRTASQPLARDPVLGRGGRRSAAHRAGADRRDPEGAGSGGGRRRATSISSRSTRPSARFPSPPRARSASTRRSATSTGAAAASGHPIAATGARMVVTMVHELRRRGARLGCVSMCAGGGMGMAMVVEAL